MTIYIVTAWCGLYEDRVDWLVKAFKTEKAAKRFADACNERASEIHEYNSKLPKGHYDDNIVDHSYLDPDFIQTADEPTSYTYLPLEIE